MTAARPIPQPEDAELDRAVWRILSCARAAGVEVSDDKLRSALKEFAPERLVHLAAARTRAANDLDAHDEVGSTNEASTTLDEALDSGLLGITREEWEQACASST